MKKRTLRERKEAFKQAYRNELIKGGVIDSLDTKTVAELKKMALEEGIKLTATKKADIIESINTYRENKIKEEKELKRLEEEKQVLLNELSDIQDLTEENFSMTNDELKEYIKLLKETPEETQNNDDSNEENSTENNNNAENNADDKEVK